MWFTVEMNNLRAVAVLATTVQSPKVIDMWLNPPQQKGAKPSDGGQQTVKSISKSGGCDR